MDRPVSPAAVAAPARGLVTSVRDLLASPIVILLLAALPPALVTAWSNGKVDASALDRAALVGASALLVIGSAIFTMLRTRRHPDTRSALMGVAFIAMSVVLAARVAAMLPGPACSPGIARWTEMATLPLGAVLLTLSIMPELRTRHRFEVVSQTGPAIGLFLCVVLGLCFTEGDGVRAVPRPSSTAAELTFVVTAVLLVVLAHRAARTAVLTGRRGDHLVVGGLMTSVFAFWGIANAYRNDALWWTSHGLELVGLAAMCLPAALDLLRPTSSRPLVGDLRATDIVADEEGFLDGRIHHLMLQLGRKDGVTEDHTRRVALLAVRMGEYLGLDPSSLRDLATGGLLHDIGKLQTPDSILKKPGKLTDAEYEVIKRHPGAGAQILNEIGRFNERVVHLVEAHHERIDGAGYPHGTPASSIFLEARILAVADVFDALTSQRPYRVAWPADRALELIERDAGRAFDPRCVEALRAIVAKDHRHLPPMPWRLPGGGRAA